MSQPFPMLAATAEMSKVAFPVIAFPKIDGIRMVVHDKRPLSRKLITIPNRFVQGFFSSGRWDGLDGELVVGKANDPLCIKHTTSGVMSHNGEPDFTFFVFDKWDGEGGYEARYSEAARVLEQRGQDARVVLLQGTTIHNADALFEYEADQLELGYEGIIVRGPNAAYKHGRSTLREGGLLKIKQFEDSEAEVLDVIEEMHNGNEATKDNLGRTKRSSAKGQMVGKGRMGALHVRDIHSGAVFEVGAGFTVAEREWWWRTQAKGLIVKYKYFPVGMQAKPRHPVFVALRDKRDL